MRAGFKTNKDKPDFFLITKKHFLCHFIMLLSIFDCSWPDKAHINKADN